MNNPLKLNKKYIDEIAVSKEFKELKFDEYDMDMLSKQIAKHANIKHPENLKEIYSSNIIETFSKI